MKKVILLAVAGLVVGLGGGTGIAIVTAPKAGADSTHADSARPAADSTVELAAHEAAAGDSATPPAHGEGAAPPAADSAAPVAAAPDGAPAAATPVAPAGTTGAEADSAARVQLRRISRTFASMAPRDAAKVLELMEDGDVNAIIGSLTEKQAAAILAAFPPARAAAISRARMDLARGRVP